MTERNFKKELLYSSYIDMEEGRDTESIDYECLISIITELHQRIEELEKWKSRVQKVSREVSNEMKGVTERNNQLANNSRELSTKIEELTAKIKDDDETRDDRLKDKIQDYRDELKNQYFYEDVQWAVFSFFVRILERFFGVVK